MIRKVKDGVLIDVEVIPNASKTAMLGSTQFPIQGMLSSIKRLRCVHFVRKNLYIIFIYYYI